MTEPLIERADVDTLLVTIDVMELVRFYGHPSPSFNPAFVLWSCRLCDHTTTNPGEATALRAIGDHMRKDHRVRLVAPVVVA